MPAFSPDGRALAFCRLPGTSVSEICVLPLDSNFRPSGEARRLTDHKRWSAQPVWIRGGRSILYVFGEDATRRREIRIINVANSSNGFGNYTDQRRRFGSRRWAVTWCTHVRS